MRQDHGLSSDVPVRSLLQTKVYLQEWLNAQVRLHNPLSVPSFVSLSEGGASFVVIACCMLGSILSDPIGCFCRWGERRPPRRREELLGKARTTGVRHLTSLRRCAVGGWGGGNVKIESGGDFDTSGAFWSFGGRLIHDPARALVRSEVSKLELTALQSWGWK
jgi:hypothetical protein